MLTAATLIKRLETLERSREGGTEIKTFIHYVEENPPFWKPGNPEAWQKLHPKGKAILLSRRNFRRQAV